MTVPILHKRRKFYRGRRQTRLKNSPQNEGNNLGPNETHLLSNYGDNFNYDESGAENGQLENDFGHNYDYTKEPNPPTLNLNNGTESSPPPVIIRGEEVGIVGVIILLWIGAIVLFFNRWGKIRMLEPYQPKFCEAHRPSCPIADVGTIPHCPRSYSKYNLSTEMLGAPHFAKCNYHGINPSPGVQGGVSKFAMAAASTSLAPNYHFLHESKGNLNKIKQMAQNRPRQNSVFVTSPNIIVNPGGNFVLRAGERKSKSAFDLSSLVLSDEFQEKRRNSKISVSNV